MLSQSSLLSVLRSSSLSDCLKTSHNSISVANFSLLSTEFHDVTRDNHLSTICSFLELVCWGATSGVSTQKISHCKNFRTAKLRFKSLR